VVNSTIAYNWDDGYGPGIYDNTGSVTLDNTIVDSNTVGTGIGATELDLGGVTGFGSSQYNLVGTDGTSSLPGGEGNQVGVTNPGLGGLANNGGPTQTIALLAGSPAIDAGSNALAVDQNGNPLLTDQRGTGYARIVNGTVDIGAFERSIATTITLTAAPNPTVFGQSVTFTVNVKPAPPNRGTPTGSVAFFDGSINLGNATLSNGKATFKTTSLPVGPDPITAVYSGDTTFATSTSAVLSQRVNQAATTSKVTSSTNPAVYGQTVTFTATVKAVSPGSGTPTGTVTFDDDGSPIGTGTLSGGTATFSTDFVVPGSQSITVGYGGDANFTGSTSPAITQTVNQAASTTTVTAAPNPSVYGQSLTLTASVSAKSPGSGTPTGTVTFTWGSTTLGSGTLSNGTVTITATTPLTVGTDTIKAAYSGDGNFKTSTGTTSQTVNQAATTTALVSSVNASVFGQSVTFTATVSANAPGSGTPTGSVTFRDGSTTLGTVTLSGGVASYTTAKLATTSHAITATYNGSGSFTTSSASLTQTVNQDGTMSVVTSSLDPSTSGQKVTFTATVSAVSPGAGTPTGTVIFYDGMTEIGTGTLSGAGKATLATKTLTAGSHSISVQYSGDTNFLASTSAVFTQTVNSVSGTSLVASGLAVDAVLGAIPADGANGLVIDEVALGQVNDGVVSTRRRAGD
jgi:hypothetical protein